MEGRALKCPVVHEASKKRLLLHSRGRSWRLSWLENPISPMPALEIQELSVNSAENSDRHILIRPLPSRTRVMSKQIAYPTPMFSLHPLKLLPERPNIPSVSIHVSSRSTTACRIVPAQLSHA